jgi:transposase-like protein
VLTEENTKEDVVVASWKKGIRITGGDRKKLSGEFVELYTGGQSIRSIATECGRSYGFVHRVLSEAGVELRGRGGATRGPRRPPR